MDGVFLIHAGAGAETEPDPAKRPNMIWSHKWVLPKEFEKDGVKAYAYSTEPEDGRVGVFAHEFGHVLGLPDLYDSTYFSRGVGDWCLMGSGSWGDNPKGSNPCRLSCWCLAKLNWIKPKNVRKAEDLTLPPLADDPAACRRLWSKGKKGTEYFLIENRQRRGRDASLPGSGLAVWHIDETQSDNTTPVQYLVALFRRTGNATWRRTATRGTTATSFPAARTRPPSAARPPHPRFPTTRSKRAWKYQKLPWPRTAG